MHRMACPGFVRMLAESCVICQRGQPMPSQCTALPFCQSRNFTGSIYGTWDMPFCASLQSVVAQKMHPSQERSWSSRRHSCHHSHECTFGAPRILGSAPPHDFKFTPRTTLSAAGQLRNFYSSSIVIDASLHLDKPSGMFVLFSVRSHAWPHGNVDASPITTRPRHFGNRSGEFSVCERILSIYAGQIPAINT